MRRSLMATRVAVLLALTCAVSAVPARAQDPPQSNYYPAALCQGWAGLYLLPDFSPANFTNAGDCVSALNNGLSVIVFSVGAGSDSGQQTLIGWATNAQGMVEDIVVKRPPAGPCVQVTALDGNGNTLTTVAPGAGAVAVGGLTGIYYVAGPGNSQQHGIYFSNLDLRSSICTW